MQNFWNLIAKASENRLLGPKRKGSSLHIPMSGPMSWETRCHSNHFDVEKTIHRTLKNTWATANAQVIPPNFSDNPSNIKWDLTNGPLGKVLELLDTQV